VLQKLKLLVTPGLDDVESRLREQLAQSSEFRGRRYDELKTSSEALRNLIFEASSLAGVNLIPEYLALCSGSPQAVRNEHVIQSKRITSAIVSETLKRGLSSSTLLRTRQLVPIEELPTGMKTMEIKMAAGGLSVSELTILKILSSPQSIFCRNGFTDTATNPSFIMSIFVWLFVTNALRHNKRRGKRKGLTETACWRILGSGFSEEQPLGQRKIPECYKEHLLGMAGILTEDCTVWWSAEFNLPDETA